MGADVGEDGDIRNKDNDIDKYSKTLISLESHEPSTQTILEQLYNRLGYFLTVRRENFESYLEGMKTNPNHFEKCPLSGCTDFQAAAIARAIMDLLNSTAKRGEW